ncbi:major royal jelly protein [Xanthomonas citri pv. aurantifolii]|uniref:L-dopachrome tautomerase-related protein n=1 Tax=Xanthomonas citri TaxID=346 RepID=UPI0009C22C53|nr:major royal jelly protein [Xanthomonas citri pv. aurantifolii]ARE58828.1 major royal jelly protein [Xanthomonas citri pv. aurantifolii]
MPFSFVKHRSALLVAAALTGAISLSHSVTALAAMAQPAKLVAVRESQQMPWNAVARDGRGRFIVSSPRWTGNTGPAVAIAQKDGSLTPFPDAQWNSWKPGSETARKFVSINAIHQDTNGDLWIVDTGTPEFGGTPVAEGAKVVHIDPRNDTVVRVYTFSKEVIREHSYVDDIRLNGEHAYLTDAGEGAVIVLDLKTGAARRRFDGASFVRARAGDKIIVNGKVIRGNDGKPLQVNADPLELSPDGQTLYFGPLAGPLSQIETRYLDDDAVSEETLAQYVSVWFDNPPIGGTAMGGDGSLYYTPLADNSLMRRAPDGTLSVIARDSQLRWVDAPLLDDHGHIYLPVPQIDGAPAFNDGKSTIRFPVKLYQIDLRASCVLAGRCAGPSRR